MSSEFGRTLRVGVFGQSHGAAIGVTVDGLPAGERIDLAELQAFLDRRKPGKSPLSTARKEADAPEFLSGLRDGVTCGSPLCSFNGFVDHLGMTRSRNLFNSGDRCAAD